jgi:hypothetical protein
MKPPESLWGLAGRVFLWLVPAFAAWHFAAPAIAAVQALGASIAISAWFPGLFRGWELAGASIELASRIDVAQGGRIGQLVVTVDGRLFSYGVPLYLALCLAVDPRKVAAMLLGLLALVPFLVWGVAFDALRQVFITMGPLTARDYAATGFERNAIALGYQLGTLFFPALSAVMVWAVAHRAFIARWIPAPVAPSATA